MDEWARFLAARLDEDEAEIQKHPDDDLLTPDGYLATAETHYPCEPMLIISKKRALADIAAKRNILDAYEATALTVNVSNGTVLAGATKIRLGAYAKVVKTLCEPFASHPAYPGERP